MPFQKDAFRFFSYSWLVFAMICSVAYASHGPKADSSLIQQVDSLVIEAAELEYEDPRLARDKGKESLQLAISQDYHQGQRDAFSVLGKSYLRTADYDSAEYCLNQAWRMDSLVGGADGKVVSLATLANLCTRKGQFKEAIDYYYRALEISENNHLDDYTAKLYNNVAGRYRDLDRPDKSMEYCWKAIDIWKEMAGQEDFLGHTYLNLSILCNEHPELRPEDDPQAVFTYLDRAEEYFRISNNEFKLNDCKLNRSNSLVGKEGKNREAFRLAREARDYFERTGNLLEAAEGHLMMGQSLIALGRYNEALEMIRKARKIGEESEIYDIEQRALFRESEALMHLGQYEQSNKLLNQAYAFRDSVLGHGLKAELSEIQEKYNLSRERADRLEMEGIAMEEKSRADRLKNTVIIISLVAALLFAFFMFFLRQRQNREKVRTAEFQRHLADERTQVADLKLKMLGAQMNPHFVKNALSSIQSLLQKKDATQSNTYLEAFTRLQKTLLETSSDHTISLEDELQLIQDYVKIEQLRFDMGFELILEGTEVLDLEYDRIPSMMLQPIIENAINHGLFHKGAPGRVRIKFERVDADDVELLRCTVEDDGVGLEYTKALNTPGRKSRSMEILRQRLALLSKHHEHPLQLQMRDLKAEAGNTSGTQIIVIIPLV